MRLSKDGTDEHLVGSNTIEEDDGTTAHVVTVAGTGTGTV